MKNIWTIAMSIWLLFAANGFVVNFHYCQGALQVPISLSSEDHACKSDQNSCCKNDRDCCTDIYEFVDTDINQIYPTYYDFTDIEFPALDDVTGEEDVINNANLDQVYNSRPPPQDDPFYILYESYLL